MTPPTQQLVIDIDALAVGPALDAAVAELILGWFIDDKDKLWKDKDGDRVWLYRFSMDANQARLVEAEIVARQLTRQYTNYLVGEVYPDKSQQAIQSSIDERYVLIVATPEQKCRAALRTIRQELLP
jgi:hypothetical protein